MAYARNPLAKRHSWLKSSRKDSWWIPQLFTAIVLLGFIGYANFRVFENAHYEFGTLLSPFYSPLLFGPADSHHAWFSKPDWLPRWISPAFLILWAPAGFRLTCYYYRGAYYKAIWQDPPGCGVGEPRKGYLGEKFLPLVVQNLHRYFLYFALLFIPILTWDVWNACWDGYGDSRRFSIGLGTLLLFGATATLALYTFSCHSLRHLIGGNRDKLSDRPAQSACYNCVSALNKNHMLYAWISLFLVAFADLYVRLCSTGAISDLRFF